MNGIVKVGMTVIISFMLIQTCMAQTPRNYNDATGFVFGSIQFNMQYKTAKSFLLDAPEDYQEEDGVFLSVGQFGNKLWDMLISDTVEMGFHNKKLNKLIFTIDPKDLNAGRITKEFTKAPETLTDGWAYWVKGNYVLDITTDSVTRKKRIQLEYMGW
ncbi:MAG: hypothetical protein ACO1N0_07215 [Fluviicola sp.]